MYSIRTPSRKFVMTSGQEGPRHDPYGYKEYTVYFKEGGSITLHEGLLEYIEIENYNGKRRFARNNYRDVRSIFVNIAGLTPEQIEKAYRKLTSRCRNCGGYNFVSMEGYPGEEFDVCADCGSVVASRFDINAVI